MRSVNGRRGYMIAKQSLRVFLISLSFLTLFLVLPIIGAIIGFFTGYLLIGSLRILFENLFNNAMFPWLGLFYGICIFLIGVTFCIKLFRRAFLQNAEGKMVEQPSLTNFMRFVPARLLVGFIAGITFHAVIVISTAILVVMSQS